MYFQCQPGTSCQTSLSTVFLGNTHSCDRYPVCGRKSAHSNGPPSSGLPRALSNLTRAPFHSQVQVAFLFGAGGGGGVLLGCNNSITVY